MNWFSYITFKITSINFKMAIIKQIDGRAKRPTHRFGNHDSVNLPTAYDLGFFVRIEMILYVLFNQCVCEEGKQGSPQIPIYWHPHTKSNTHRLTHTQRLLVLQSVKHKKKGFCLKISFNLIRRNFWGSKANSKIDSQNNFKGDFSLSSIIPKAFISKRSGCIIPLLTQDAYYSFFQLSPSESKSWRRRENEKEESFSFNWC